MMLPKNKTSRAPADQAAELRRRVSKAQARPEVIYDLAADYWTGRGWLVLAAEGEPARASFATEAEAREYAEPVAAGAEAPALPSGFVCTDWDGLA